MFSDDHEESRDSMTGAVWGRGNGEASAAEGGRKVSQSEREEGRMNNTESVGKCTIS